MYGEQQLKDIINNVRYLGVFYANPPMPCGAVGDVALCASDGYLYMCVGKDRWEWICPYEDTEQEEYPTNCVNCGAVLHSSKCEYCGTENRR